MADADDVRRLALALPHVEEIDCDGFDFRVGGKGFVWSYPERQPGQRRVLRTDIAVLYVGDEAEKQALLLGEPAVFFTTPGYEGWPLVMLRLAEVDAGRLAELMTDAWRMRAPAELSTDFEAASDLLMMKDPYSKVVRPRFRRLGGRLGPSRRPGPPGGAGR